tara:strand:+ start:103 stop:450 length:348 start_codon:yes stop_codon:yes gene_type:complete
MIDTVTIPADAFAWLLDLAWCAELDKRSEALLDRITDASPDRPTRDLLERAELAVAESGLVGPLVLALPATEVRTVRGILAMVRAVGSGQSGTADYPVELEQLDQLLTEVLSHAS